jgi:membrane-associated protease RseP (regulator of RpoE activity)
VAALGLGPGPQGAGAQIVQVLPAGEPTGWIGVAVEISRRPDGPERGGRDPRIRITGVRPGSPAARAGLRPGDLLLSLDGRDPGRGLGPILRALEPGDTVALVVLRDGRERTIRLRAGTRPAELRGPEARWVTVRADTLLVGTLRGDSLAAHMFRAMDSLRVRIRPRRNAPPRLPEAATAPAPPWQAGAEGLIRLIREEAAAGPTVPKPLPAPPPGASPAPEPPEDPGREATVTLRPLAPYALGRNRAAGAEVVELKPELAAYFDVEGGVLVVEVAPGTPAARAGLRPGDVLTRVGGVDVASMGHVRAGLAQPRDSVPVRLVRKGTVMEVVLRR